MRQRKPKCGLLSPDLALAYYEGLPHFEKVRIRVENSIRYTYAKIQGQMLDLSSYMLPTKFVGLSEQVKKIYHARVEKLVNPPVRLVSWGESLGTTALPDAVELLKLEERLHK